MACASFDSGAFCGIVVLEMGGQEKKIVFGREWLPVLPAGRLEETRLQTPITFASIWVAKPAVSPPSMGMFAPVMNLQSSAARK